MLSACTEFAKAFFKPPPERWNTDLVGFDAQSSSLAGQQKHTPLTAVNWDKLMPKMAEKMRVLGIDCGTEYTGFGVCDQDAAGKLAYVVAGAIKLRKSDALPVKLAHVFETLAALIREHQPDIVAIEEVFYSVNAKSALKLGQVRGVAMLAASSAGLCVAEYAPLSIKSAVTGYGKAEKHQVQQMVMRLLQLPAPPEPADAADALAIAICHLHTAGTQQRMAARR